MSLSSNIMNLQTVMSRDDLIDLFDVPGMHAYKEGHRDARHAAVELALKAEALIEDMRIELENILDWLEQGDYDPSLTVDMKSLIERAKEYK